MHKGEICTWISTWEGHSVRYKSLHRTTRHTLGDPDPISAFFTCQMQVSTSWSTLRVK